MWVNLVTPFYCTLGLQKLFIATIPAFGQPASHLTYMIIRNAYFLQTYFESMTIMLNMVLSIDLVVTLRRPFQNPEKRYPIYLATAITLPIFPAMIREVSFDWAATNYGRPLSILYLLEIAIAIFSIAYSIWFLRKSGINGKVLKTIIFRHVCYIIVNIFCQTYAIGSRILLSGVTG